MRRLENRTKLMMYQTEDGQTKIDVRMENDTVWMSLDQWQSFSSGTNLRFPGISGTSSPKANWIARQLLQNLQQLPQTEKRNR